MMASGRDPIVESSPQLLAALRREQELSSAYLELTEQFEKAQVQLRKERLANKRLKDTICRLQKELAASRQEEGELERGLATSQQEKEELENGYQQALSEASRHSQKLKETRQMISKASSRLQQSRSRSRSLPQPNETTGGSVTKGRQSMGNPGGNSTKTRIVSQQMTNMPHEQIQRRSGLLSGSRMRAEKNLVNGKRITKKFKNTIYDGNHSTSLKSMSVKSVIVIPPTPTKEDADNTANTECDSSSSSVVIQEQELVARALS